MNLVQLDVAGLRTPEKRVSYYDQVDECPVCRAKGHPKQIAWRVHDSLRTKLWIVYQCPSLKCQAVFVGEFGYEHASNAYSLRILFPKNFAKVEFPKVVIEVSPDFSEIYNQALKAESYGLNHICGPGFRKALEFLVKDFCILKNPASNAEIKALLLGKCIKKYIADPTARKIAERAAWLGNDETHYERRWEDKDVQDLKMLIRLTVNFVENEQLTELYLAAMPQSESATSTT